MQHQTFLLLTFGSDYTLEIITRPTSTYSCKIYPFMLKRIRWNTIYITGIKTILFVSGNFDGFFGNDDFPIYSMEIWSRFLNCTISWQKMWSTSLTRFWWYFLLKLIAGVKKIFLLKLGIGIMGNWISFLDCIQVDWFLIHCFASYHLQPSPALETEVPSFLPPPTEEL